MNPFEIVTLIEKCFSALEGLCATLIGNGVVPSDHPAVQQVAVAKQAVADAKTASGD